MSLKLPIAMLATITAIGGGVWAQSSASQPSSSLDAPLRRPMIMEPAHDTDGETEVDEAPRMAVVHP